MVFINGVGCCKYVLHDDDEFGMYEIARRVRLVAQHCHGRNYGRNSNVHVYHHRLMYKEIENVNIDNRITTSHSGTTVLLRYPMPNGRRDPSALYMMLGLYK